MLLSTMSKWILCAEIVLISSGVVSLVSAVRFAAPAMMNFVVHGMPTLWAAAASFLKPPYVYVIVNGIIIVIVASSRFSPSEPSPSSSSSLSSCQSRPLISVKTPPPVEISVQMAAEEEVVKAQEGEEEVVVVYEVETAVEVKEPVVVNGFEVVPLPVEVEEAVASWSAYTYSQEKSESVTEIPTPVITENSRELSEFGHHFQLRGEKSQSKTRPAAESEATLDGIWRMITQGRRVPPPTRRLRKSLDMFENHRCPTIGSSSPTDRHISKSKTLRDRTNFYRDYSSSSIMDSRKIVQQREPSLSQEELNRRVEEFIQKFNEEMRLQRQESLKQYMNRFNRAS